MSPLPLLIAPLLWFAAPPTAPQEPPAPPPARGIVGQAAPPWRVDRWLQLPVKGTAIDVADFRGKVIYLYAFQSWCPGCHSRGFPTLQESIKRFAGEPDVAFVAVQTAFEGFHANTPQAAHQTAARYGLSIPLGHSGSAGAPSGLMRDYRTGGTPWTIIIDRAGVVRFNDFHVTPDAAEGLMRELLRQPAPAAPGPGPPIETLPAQRGGQDRVGARLGRLDWDRVLEPAGSAAPVPVPAPAPVPVPGPAPPRATLYRWWTDACPYCEATLPALEALRRRYQAHGLRVVAAYHPKPPRPVDDDFVRAAAARLGFHGALAVDEDWSVLRQEYLRFAERSATSISLLVDGDGVIQFVHPGPVFFPSADPAHARENEDHRLLEQAIRALLRMPPDRPDA
jgi:thiol-disulfide isomerase/thioredoxin